jgi:soluble lytic murein transglycosylase-like protein
MSPRIVLALAMALIAPSAAADLYGYVDENGVPHWSNLPLEGYVLFRKDAPSATPDVGVSATEPRARDDSNAGTTRAARKRYTDLIAQVAREQRIDAALLHAVITVESGYNERAKSPKGASGLMQLTRETAQRYGVRDIWNPLENLRGGARYLRDLLALFKDDLNLALAAYNAGEGAVIGSGRQIPPYAETRSYVPRVLQHYDRYRASARL